MSTVQHITPLQLLIAMLLVLIAGVISILMRVKLEKQLAIASLRTVLQLLLVGYILKYVFLMSRWYLVVVFMALMIGFATHASVNRTKRKYNGIIRDSAYSLIISSLATCFIVTHVVIQVHPWYKPQYVIPLLGMILGNSLTGISIAVDQLLNDLVDKRSEIEMELAHGATAWEAARSPLSEAVRRGMIPTINGMMVVGIVSLPGMMTGQILAGSDPMEAVSYQIVVMFMIAAASAIGCMLIALLIYRSLFNERHQLLESRILKRS